MHDLIRNIIKEVLADRKNANKKIKIGIIGGGFKPPTKGHFSLAEKALEEIPDLDKLLIYVGGRVRKDAAITQKQAIEIWKLYAKKLEGNITILPADQPISKPYSQASKNPETEVYWFLGIRNNKDKKEADERESHLRKNPDKYPNLNAIRITDTGTDVSGTKARRALLDNNKELFFTYLPDEVDKEQVWNLIHNNEK